MKLVNIIKDKKVAILGFGRHGGGLSSTRFVLSQSPASVTIIDKVATHILEEMLLPLGQQRTEVSTDVYEPSIMKKFDIVIKNPAIQHHAEILKHISHIETDISLYYQYQTTPTWMITGTKGKSSISTALYNLLATQNLRISLSGNITSSPLNILLNQQAPEKIVLEASSFQLGDLSLVNATPFRHMELMILTNIMPDHLNYYPNMQEYVADKLIPFQNLTEQSFAILPYTSDTVTIDEAIDEAIDTAIDTAIDEAKVTLTLHNNVLTLPISQCYFHAQEYLPQALQGCYAHDGGIYARKHPHSEPTLLAPTHSIPAHIPMQNICIVCCAHIVPLLPNISLPQNTSEWEQAFTVPHRKEKVRELNGRIFFNDSAATIPQAIQLSLFQNKKIRLIAGGTDKNLTPQDLVEAISSAASTYLLAGSYTDQVIPLLEHTTTCYKGPFTNLKEAVHSAYQESNSGDLIILSPGCASFGMFLHEFDRGDQFKALVQNLS